MLERVRALGAGERPAALATLVEVAGSSYRREGARMLIEAGGGAVGVLSGGCLERDLERAAAAACAEGAPRTVVYDLQAEEEAVWGFGLGCEGKVTLLVEPLEGKARERLETTLATILEHRRELRIATLFDCHGSPAAALGESLFLVRDRESSSERQVERQKGKDEGFIEGKDFGRGALRPDSGAETAAPSPLQWNPFVFHPLPSFAEDPKDQGLVEGKNSGCGGSGVEPGGETVALPFFHWKDSAFRLLLGLAPGEARAERIVDVAGGGSVALLLESLLPPPHLVVVGGERDVSPLLRLGRELGWETTAVVARPSPEAEARLAPHARFVVCAARELASGTAVELSSRTAVVIATHRYLDDLAYLGELAAAGADVGYLAVLGPARRRERLLADLVRQGHATGSAPLALLRGPAGLALGGRSPVEVALSIVAEIQAVLSGGAGRPLSAAFHALTAEAVSSLPLRSP